MSRTLESFIGAQNFCTGSQTDFSTCIANNMKFSKYLDDVYEATKTVSVKISNTPTPLIYGKSYVELKPLAMANVLTRMLETNSYGAVKFRCLDVYNQPRLPLPSLQDLGLAKNNLLDIIEVPEIHEEHTDDTPTYEDIPIYSDNKLNVLNFMIGFSTSVSKVLTMSREIKSIINQHLNYYDLPDKARVGLAELDKAGLLIDKTLEFIEEVLNDGSGEADIYNLIKQLLQDLKQGNNNIGSYSTLLTKFKNQIHDPLVNSINDDTDFSHYDFSITEGVALAVTQQEKDDYPTFLATSLYLKYLADLDRGNGDLAHKIVSTYSGLLLDIYPGFFATLSTFYSSYNDLSIFKLRNAVMLDWQLKHSTQIFHDLALQVLKADDPKHDEYTTVIEGFLDLVNLFTAGTVVDDLSEDIEQNNTVLDTYYNNLGYNIKIEVSSLADKIQKLYETLSTGLTEVKFGTDYKDSGKFFYADLAYSVGIGKLEKIYSIKIDDEYYDFGSEGVAISESGCTKYTFTRRVLPTFDYKVDMYIYPGTPNQPYCPTVNTYHNFGASKYSGMFTKMEGEQVGLYVYTGYRPMKATVEKVTKIGEVNYNSINLNDPSMDPKSYETMLKKEIKNLTNATSINGEPISTDDLKYYTSSEIDEPLRANNYPTLAIIDFRRFPLKSNLNFPKITVFVKSTDIISKG